MKVFVYGTLKEGGEFAKGFNKYRKSVQEATLDGFSLYCLGWFPGIVPGEGQVVGELHTYNHAAEKTILRMLDQIEGYSSEYEETSLYLRRIVTVTTDEGEEEAYAYIFNQGIPDDADIIKDGHWPI